MFDFVDFLYEAVAAIVARLTGGSRLKALALIATIALAILLLALLTWAFALR
ncbi:MAG: hypothetical protein OXC19_09585 [Bryobacterales bacterium]|nr:hypothetical protein [Bryobacterales bacterium]